MSYSSDFPLLKNYDSSKERAVSYSSLYLPKPIQCLLPYKWGHICGVLVIFFSDGLLSSQPHVLYVGF